MAGPSGQGVRGPAGRGFLLVTSGSAKALGPVWEESPGREGVRQVGQRGLDGRSPALDDGFGPGQGGVVGSFPSARHEGCQLGCVGREGSWCLGSVALKHTPPPSGPCKRQSWGVRVRWAGAGQGSPAPSLVFLEQLNGKASRWEAWGAGGHQALPRQNPAQGCAPSAQACPPSRRLPPPLAGQESAKGVRAGAGAGTGLLQV